ncbi:MAG: trigger factor [Chitinophagales bacterium]|nr:trigger factor [Chitinophagales bacterium]
MNITKEQIDDLNAVLTVDIDVADYQDKMEEALKNLRKKVDMKGFRKGMVPPGLVKKMYGNQVLADELDKLINNHVTEYLKNNDINILGNPLPKEDTERQNIDAQNPSNYKFVFDLGLVPAFDLGGYLGKDTILTQYSIQPDEAEVEKEVANLRKRFGKMGNPDDTVKEDDVIYVQWTELTESGEPKEGGVDHASPIAVDMIADAATVTKLLAMKPGDSIEVDIFALLDKEKAEIAKQLLNVDAAKADELSPNFKLTIQRINRVELAELDQEFFDKIFGVGVVTTEEEFTEHLRNELVKAYANEGRRKFEYDLMEDLLDSVKINLPDSFMKRWLKVSNEKPITEEEVEQGYADFARNLKWQLIVNKLSRDNNLTVTAEDIREEVKASIQRQFGQMQGFSLDDEQLDEWAESMMKNKEHVQKTYEFLMGQRLIDYIQSQITVNEKPVSLEEFKKLN